MGSYNVACSVSSISIHPGEKVIFIPLQVSQYPNRIGDGNHTLIYPWAFYSPVTLPIFGEYGDYGRIDEVVRDENVERIENHFSSDIEEVCDPQTYHILPITSGMFCLEEIYWTLVTKCLNDSGTISMTRKNIARRYEDLREALNPEPLSWDLSGAVARMRFLDARSGNILGFREYEKLPEIYHPAIKEGRLKKELIDWARFEISMFATNKLYFPAQNGYQFGNPHMERVLSKKALEISRRRRG